MGTVRPSPDGAAVSAEVLPGSASLGASAGSTPGDAAGSGPDRAGPGGSSGRGGGVGAGGRGGTGGVGGGGRRGWGGAGGWHGYRGAVRRDPTVSRYTASRLSPERRAEDLRRMRAEQFDVLIIGGGVTGVGA